MIIIVGGMVSNKSNKYKICMEWNASELGFPRVDSYEEWDLGPLIIALGLRNPSSLP